METRDLQTFLAVAASGSITRAADMLGRSQPSVSRIIQDLEAELGFQLFHRTGRRVQLSEEGVAFEIEARRLLSSFTELAARAKAIAGGKGRIFQVAATAAMAWGLIPNAIARVTGDLPFEVHVAQHVPSAVAQDVRTGRAEIGFSSLPLDVPGLEVLRLYAASNVVALRADDPLAAEDVVPLAVFTERTLVTMLDPLRFQARVARLMETRGLVPKAIIRTNVALGALQMVRQTGGVAIIDPVTAYGGPLPDIVVRPLDVAVPFHWGVIAPLGRPLRPLTLALVDAAEAVAREAIPDLQILDPAGAGEAAGAWTPPEPTDDR
ncbi:LysR family transcriptional regulator [Falsirhodobacter sp. 20TX0035]|uniref:LysR family transcriptional regulator n=1 Tax=Falsirhodobacter sp. 20TX0035 TaxID=3022019 RepID=UPI00233124E7|nr:LysR family transcriptional regulator [Falsirhodobacter sp. 20TX0035]MDB6453036.1 LysR family transcriptional regulator [Falsirhodobacter sp. 20TX0035]